MDLRICLPQCMMNSNFSQLEFSIVLSTFLANDVLFLLVDRIRQQVLPTHDLASGDAQKQTLGFIRSSHGIGITIWHAHNLVTFLELFKLEVTLVRRKNRNYKKDMFQVYTSHSYIFLMSLKTSETDSILKYV